MHRLIILKVQNKYMDFEEENEKLINYIKSTGHLKSKRIEEALRKISRHLFVPETIRHMAYRDTPLSIGNNQTISQPSTVVAMTEALDVKEGQKVLEIGTGSGWQGSILSYLVGEKGFVFDLHVAGKNILGRKTIILIDLFNLLDFGRDGPVRQDQAVATEIAAVGHIAVIAAISPEFLAVFRFLA